jgi:hypothetical protein
MSTLKFLVSAPRENGLFVPFRNVVLTEPCWGGGRTGSFDDDPAGQRPAVGPKEGKYRGLDQRFLIIDTTLLRREEKPLGTAQREISTDWIAAYKKYFHTDEPIN